MTSLLSEASKNRLLRIARDSLHEFLKNNKRKIFTEETPELQTKRAVFVTLRKRDSGDLRGCIGQTEARYPLVEAVAKTAISSAVDDSRFPQVTLNELPKLNIEINVLTEMTTIDPQAIVVGKHGLLLRKGFSGGLFLPEVAISNGWDRITFLDQLCRKADLPQGSWQDPEVELFCFEAEAWEEN